MFVEGDYMQDPRFKDTNDPKVNTSPNIEPKDTAQDIAQGVAEDRRISIRSIKLSSAPRSIANEIEVSYQIQKPMKKYVGMSDTKEHQFKMVVGIEHEGAITMPVNPEKDLDILSALFTLKCECEEKLSSIFNIQLDSNHPNFKALDSKK